MAVGLGGGTLVVTAGATWVPADRKDVRLMKRKVPETSKFLGGSVPENEATEPAVSNTDQVEWSAACGDFFPGARPRKVCGDPNDWNSPEFYATLPPGRGPAVGLPRRAGRDAQRGSVQDVPLRRRSRWASAPFRSSGS